jgi:hypothetical protein
MHTEKRSELADAVRTACLNAAIDAYEDAGVRGLCHEGRWEVALDAIRSLDVRIFAVRSESM